MREPLAGVTVRLDGTAAPSSTTIAAVGASVLVLATTLPTQPLTLTSCYLADSDSAIAASHLQVTASGELFTQYELPAAELHATLAGACLLEHAAFLRDLAGHALDSPTVTVDVDLEALDRAAEAWGSPPPPG